MEALRKPFVTLTARDLMTPTVMALPQEMRLGTAARLLRRNQVSGAPIVDQDGRCVGVITATDFLRWAEGESSGRGSDKPCASPVKPWEISDPDEGSEAEVGQFMTRDVVTVSPTTGVVVLARKMLEAHIRRLIVVDDEDRPLGIVSASDILAGIAENDVASF